MKPKSAFMALVLVAAFLLPGFSTGSPGTSTDTSSRAEPLDVEIALPEDNATYKAGSTVTFIGWSNALDDGTFDSFIWIFSKNGTDWMNISSKDEFFTMTLNETATYKVVLMVYNTRSDFATCEIQFMVVTSSYEPPVPIINYPQENQTFNDDRTSYFFNASDSYDPNGGEIDYYYWYGFNGYWKGPVKEHTIWNRLPAGRYLQTLSVRSSGLWNTTIRHFNVVYSGNNTPPVAIINAPKNNETFPVNSSVKFSSSASYDPDGSIANRTWRIRFGATLLKTVLDEVNFTYVFPVEGSYTIELFVIDNGGKERSAWMNVQIGGENRPPVANILSPAAGTTHFVGEPIDFSSEGSYDPEGDALEYDWTFGEGAGSALANPAHSYSWAGEYVVTLAVVDPAGLAGSMTISIFVVSHPQGLRAIIVSPVNASVHDISTGIRFSADAYSEVPTPNYTFEWDFGDGTTGSGQTLTHSYSAAGTYSVLLRVSDGANDVTVLCVVVISDLTPQNREPVALIVVSDDRQNLTFPVNMSIRFSGAGSYDPEGKPLTYHWTIQGSAAGDASEIVRSFGSVGELLVTLSVSDGLLSAYASVGIHIYEQPSPRIIIPPGQNGVKASGGSLFTNTGTGIRFDGSGGAGAVSRTTYWDFGDGHEATGQSATHVYTRPGTYKVTYIVKDGYSTLTAELQVTVKAPVRAANGSAPATAYALAAGIALLAVGLVAFLGWTELGMGLLLPFLVFLYSKISRDEILDNFVRGRISGYIVANPGDNYSSIRDALRLSNGAVAFHLRKLESEEVIKSTTDGIYKRFYPAEMRVPEPNGGSLTQVQKMVFDKIVETPGITQKDIAGILNVSSQTIGYHVDALIKKGRVRRERAGISVRYYPEETTFEDA